MREQFEAWAITSAWLGLVGDDLEFIDGGYVYPEVQSAWLSWQASRESLVIALPAEDPLSKGPGDCEGGLPSFEQQCAAERNSILDECRQAIEAAGLKVKS